MTKSLLKVKMDVLKEVQNHGDMVDGVVEEVVGDGENNLPHS